jgi:hypothetical protein
LANAAIHHPAMAQLKVGSNPTTLATDANLQVEANDGKQVVVSKSTAQVGIGTSGPANSLEVNSGTASTSGVRMTQLPSASFWALMPAAKLLKAPLLRLAYAAKSLPPL